MISSYTALSNWCLCWKCNTFIVRERQVLHTTSRGILRLIVSCHGSGYSLTASHHRGQSSILWPVHVGFMVHRVAWEQVSLRLFQFFASALFCQFVTPIFFFKGTLKIRVNVRNIRAFSSNSRGGAKKET